MAFLSSNAPRNRTTRQVIVRRLKKVDQLFILTMEADNLTRMHSLAKSVCRWRPGREMKKNEVQNAENGFRKSHHSTMRTDEEKYNSPSKAPRVRPQYFSSLLGRYHSG